MTLVSDFQKITLLDNLITGNSVWVIQSIF